MSAVKKEKSKPNLVKLTKESTRLKLVNAKRVEDAQTFLNLIHVDTKEEFLFKNGKKREEQKYIYVATAQDDWDEWGFSKEELSWNTLMKILSLKDCYMSVNSFVTYKRQTKFSYQINGFFVDLDYYKEPKYANCTAEELIQIMRNDGVFDDLEPSFFVDSGNGMYIYYLLDNTINAQVKSIRKLWSKAQEKLLERFKKYGVDTKVKDVTRVTRLPGSENSKTGKIARLIYNTNKIFGYNPYKEVIRHNLKDFVNCILGELPYTKAEWKEIKKEKKAKAKEQVNEREIKEENNVTILRTVYHANCKKIQDLEKLQELRPIGEGAREYMCFLYRFYLLHTGRSKEDALRYTIMFAKAFEDFEVKGFDEEYVIKSTSKAELYYDNYIKAIKSYKVDNEGKSFAHYMYEKKCMLYTTKTIIKELNITSEEMKSLDILFDKSEKNRRARVNYNPIKRKTKYQKKKDKERAEGKLSKKEKIEIDIKKMKDLLDKGLSPKKIKTILEISDSTYKRYKKQIEK